MERETTSEVAPETPDPPAPEPVPAPAPAPRRTRRKPASAAATAPASRAPARRARAKAAPKPSTPTPRRAKPRPAPPEEAPPPEPAPAPPRAAPRPATEPPRERVAEERPRDRRGGLFLGDLARKFISTGVEALGMGEESVRHIVQDNKEAVSGLLESALKRGEEVGRLKEDLSRATHRGKEEVGRLRGDAQKILSREIRRQIERIDLREELGKIFADYQLEITARISLVPHEEEPEEAGEGVDDTPRPPKKRRKDDLKVRLNRKSEREAGEDEDTPRKERLGPDRYFDDDDDPTGED